MKRARFVPVLCVVFVLVACATFQQSAYNTLYTAGVSYDTAMSVAGDLYKQGKITDAQKDKIIFYAKPFYVAYHSAVDAFEVWKKTNTAADKEKVRTAMLAILPKLTSLREYMVQLKVTHPVMDTLAELGTMINDFK